MKDNAIKVLVVDDSSLVRRVITRMLDAEKDIQVIGQATDGLEAVSKIKTLCPQVVTMAIEMSRLDGIGALRRIMKQCPVPVIMLSASTTAGARATMNALGEGAVDFVPKAFKAGELEPMLAQLTAKIRMAKQIPMRKVTGCCQAAPAKPPAPPPPPAPAKAPDKVTDQAPPKTPAKPPPSQPKPKLAQPATTSKPALSPAKPTPPVPPSWVKPKARPKVAPPVPLRPVASPAGRVGIVIIGCSTGGPVALRSIIPRLPANFPLGVVVVQHIPVGFSKSMAEHINRHSQVEVVHGSDGAPVLPGQVVIAPAGCETHFRRTGGKVTMQLKKCGQPVPPASFRPSVDQVMQSALEIYQGEILGVLLTGMGRDGAAGMLAIRQLGGRTIAQDEASSVIFGMPKAAIDLGAAEKIVPLEKIAQEITRIV